MADVNRPIPREPREKLLRPGGTAGRARKKADIDAALEEGAYVLEMCIHRARAIQTGRVEELDEKVKDIDRVDFDKLTSAMDTLIRAAPAVEAALERMSGRLDSKTDLELYEMALKHARDLGEKLGRGELTEAVVR